jgi:hypothetical protein
MEPSEKMAVTTSCWVPPTEVREKLPGVTERPLCVGREMVTMEEAEKPP